MTTRAQQLASIANERLSRIGGTVPEGFFVCPMCLRLLPLSSATEGHFPAQSVRSDEWRVVVQCSGCNNGIGGTYEAAGVDFFEFVRTVTMARPGGSGSVLRRRARVRNDDDATAVEFVKPRHRAGRVPPGRTKERLDRMLEGSPEPRAAAVTIARPTDDVAKRALLAWSYLELFRYAGYRYAASSGAALVRRLILDPNLPLPPGAVFQKGSVSMPLPIPEPSVVVRRVAPEIDELVALGVAWRGLVAVFPFADDEDDRCWSRVSELLAADRLVTTDIEPIRNVHEAFEKELIGRLDISDDRGIRRSITADLTSDEAQELAAGRSPRRLAPPSGRGWKAAMKIEHEFITIEGEPPEPPADRVAHWGSRMASLPAGYLPHLVAQLLVEIPGVPRPIPDPAPLTMKKVRTGWLADLGMSPLGIEVKGASPADAIARLLATLEREFAETYVSDSGGTSRTSNGGPEG